MGNFPYKLYPGLRGRGYAAQLDLANGGTAVTVAKTGLDFVTIPASFGVNSTNQAIAVAGVTFGLETAGTGATAGNWTLAVTRVSDGQVVASATIPYNATFPAYAVVDARTNNVQGNLKGYTLASGDTLRLDVTGVPTGITGGATGFKAHISTVHYGVDA